MKSRRNQLTLIAGAALALVLAGVAVRLVLFAPSSAHASGTVLSVISQDVLVQHRDGGDPVEAVDGQALSEGDRVMTRESGRAVITFFEGSTQTIEPNTVVTLKRLGSNDGGGLLANIGQAVGTTWTTVFDTSDAGASVQVDTPAATAAVRDTMFHIRVALGGMTSVWTRQGTVAVTAGGDDEAVTAGTMLDVEPGGASLPATVAAQANELTLTLEGVGWMLVRDPNGYSSGLVPPGAPVNQIPLAVIHDPSIRPQTVSLASPVDGEYRAYVATDEEGTFTLSAYDGLGWATRCMVTTSGSIRPGETWLVTATLRVLNGKLERCSLSDPQLTDDNPYAAIRVPQPLALALVAGRHVIPEFAVLGAADAPQTAVPSPSVVPTTDASLGAATPVNSPSVAVTPAPSAMPPPTEQPATPLPRATAAPAATLVASPAATQVATAVPAAGAPSTPIPTSTPPPAPTPTAPPAATATTPPTATSTVPPTPSPAPTATASGPCAPAWADVNGDGAVTSTDVTLIASYYNQTSPPAPAAYDVNHDHVITIADVQMVMAYEGLAVCP